MRVLGIDQSYTSTGVTVIDSDDDVDLLYYYSIIRSNIEQDKFDRAKQISSVLQDLCRANKPNYVGIEGLAFGMRGDATRDLAGLQFLIVNKIRELEIKVFIIAPNSVKKIGAGKGNAKKEEMYAALPLEVKTKFLATGAKKTTGLYDLTDSYFIAKATILEAKSLTLIKTI